MILESPRTPTAEARPRHHQLAEMLYLDDELRRPVQSRILASEDELAQART